MRKHTETKLIYYYSKLANQISVCKTLGNSTVHYYNLKIESKLIKNHLTSNYLFTIFWFWKNIIIYNIQNVMKIVLFNLSLFSYRLLLQFLHFSIHYDKTTKFSQLTIFQFSQQQNIF